MVLYDHQIKAVRFLQDRRGVGAVFADMGLGKTLIALEYFKELRKTEQNIKMIVIAPLTILDAAWGEDIKKFTNFTYCNLHDKVIKPADIILVNYESVITKKYKEFHKIVNGNLLIADESSRMKNNTSSTCKTMLFLGKFAKHKIIMTATPAPNSPMEYWGQIEFLCPGLMHSTHSFYAFRNTYFHLQRGKQHMDLRGQVLTRQAMQQMMRTGFKYEITDDNLKKLISKIEPLALRLKKEDCLTLPDRVDEVRHVTLSAEAVSHYNEMKRNLITEIKGKTITAEVALTKIMKLQQITSGWCYTPDGTVAQITNGKSKINELMNVLEEIGDKQVIIWARFQEETRQLAEILPNACTMYGGTKDKEDSINGFKEGRYKYMIANTHTAGHGLTFTNCSYCVYYSLDFSWESWIQSKNRIHRIGQKNNCTYIYLLAKNTVDEDIYNTLQKKGNMVEIVERMLAQ